VSFVVQALPSSHETPSGFLASLGQVGDAPVHVSATSH
jgi:hypothetical protein